MNGLYDTYLHLKIVHNFFSCMCIYIREGSITSNKLLGKFLAIKMVGKSEGGVESKETKNRKTSYQSF